MDDTDAARTYRGFTKQLRPVPAPLRKTLPDDRGKEMADHERLAHHLAIQVFFADPHSPWQRGTNENTNGLLRQYLPKGTDLYPAGVERHRPSAQHAPTEMLAFATPLEVYAQLRHLSPVALGTWNRPECYFKMESDLQFRVRLPTNHVFLTTIALQQVVREPR